MADSSTQLRAGRASVANAQIEARLAVLSATDDPHERAEILTEIALAFRDDLGDRGQAIDALVEAWQADPRHEPILEHLEPLLHAEGRWAEILESTRVAATTDPDRERSMVYAEAMVRWLTLHVPQPELARQWIERIRAIDSTHAVVHLLQAALSREHGDFKRELAELDLAVLSSRRADERARIHLLMAARYGEERTKNRAEAKKHFAAAHKLYPRTMEPLRGLELIAVAENDKVGLADVLRKQAEADVPDEEKVATLLRLARLEEEEFRKPDLAAKTFEQVVTLAADPNQALDGLERCYRASRAWPELARVLELGAAEATDPTVRATRLKSLGDVLESKLGDIRAAIATYERLGGILGDDETILSELARLAEKAGEIQLAVKCREKLAVLMREPAQSARMYVIAGQLLAPLDPAAARREFERAIAVDRTCQAAYNALLWDARAESDDARAERYLEERARAVESPAVRAAAFVELAEDRAHGGGGEGWRGARESAAEADPSNEAAANALAEVFVEEGRFAQADRLVDVAIASAERDKDIERLFSLLRAKASASKAMESPDRVLAATRAAHELRPDSLEASEAFIDAAFDMRADPQVLSARDALTMLADRSDGISVGGRAKLADVLVVTGDADRAACLYDDVLAEQPENERALAGLAQHHVAQGNPVAALSLKRQLARNIEDENERFQTLLEVAEQFQTKAQSDDLAAEVYEEARRVRPKDLPTLHKLLALYQKQQKWASLFDALRGIAEADADPVRRTKTLFTMAQIAMEELADRGTALTLYNQALDADPTNLKAFERIVALLTEDKDWLGLEQMYKQMIQRANVTGADPILQHALYKQIGILYRDRLKQADNAIQAYQIAVQLDPSDEQAQTILRELLARHGQADSAVAITIERVQRDPFETTPYPALFDLLVRQNARDRALCVASAMRFLGINHPAAIGLLQSYPQPPIDAIVMDLGPDGYREVLHEALDPTITEIFTVVGPAVIDIALSRLALRDRLGHPGPALKGQDWLLKMVSRAATVLGAPAPRLYARRTPGPAITFAATKPPSLLVHAQALGGIAANVLAFIVGKRVVEASPPLLARAMCPSTTELKQLGASAARIATGQMEPGDQPLAQRLSREDVARVSAAVHSAMSTTGKLDVARWTQLADASASRAGLLLCGDLEAARAAIALEPQAPGDLTPREKMRELVVWFLGDACANLRRRLGVAR